MSTPLSTNCRGDVAKVLLESYGIKKLMTQSIPTRTISSGDLLNKDCAAPVPPPWHIPTSTGAAKDVHLVTAANGTRAAWRSACDTKCVMIADRRTGTRRDLEAINAAFREAAHGALRILNIR